MSIFVDNYPNKIGALDTAFDEAFDAYISIMAQAEKCVLEKLAYTKEEFLALSSGAKKEALLSIGITGYVLNTDWSGNIMTMKLTFTGKPKDDES